MLSSMNSWQICLNWQNDLVITHTIYLNINNETSLREMMTFPTVQMTRLVKVWRNKKHRLIYSSHFLSLYYIDVLLMRKPSAIAQRVNPMLKFWNVGRHLYLHALVYGWANLLLIEGYYGKLFNELEFMRGFCFAGCRLMKIYIRLRWTILTLSRSGETEWFNFDT